MERLNDRIAVVTGGGSGIGRALSLALAAEGCTVVPTDIEWAPLDETARLVAEAGGTATPLLADVADASSVQQLADEVIERDWEWVLGVNLWGVIHGLQAFLPHLRAADEAHIVSTASVAGLIGNPGLGPYNASKFAVVGLMETLYHELRRDRHAKVGTTVLCPGPVATNIASSQRNRPEALRRARTDDATTGDARRRNANVASEVAGGISPDEVAAMVVDAIVTDRFWVVTHPDLVPFIARRNGYLEALANPRLSVDHPDQR